MKHTHPYFAWFACAALITASAFPTFAERITAEQARNVAEAFVSSHGTPLRKAPAHVISKPVYTANVSGENAYYVFNNADNAGFVIVTADDTLPSVVGYSTQGAFDYDNMPDNMKWWLEEYSRQIAYYYRTGRGARVIEKDERTPVDVLLTSNWNQNLPYNDQCPVTGGTKCPTGCAATAIAQVMYYHKWPAEGVGVTPVGIDITGHIYEWDKMLDNYEITSYTEEQKNAVATLMVDAGSAINMQYALNGSSATEANIHKGLIEHFSFNPGTKLLFHDYTETRIWEKTIYDELVAGRPVVMTGQAPTGGHCFVVDGYHGDSYYHLNWGWGGYQDGYFLLSLLNPASGGTGSFDGGYNMQQGIITNLYPKGENDTTPQTLIIAQYGMSYNSSTRKLSFGNGGALYNPIGRVQKGRLKLGFSVPGSDEVLFVNMNLVSEWKMNVGYSDLTLPSTVAIPDGEYGMAVWFDETSGGLSRAVMPIGYPQELPVKVVSGKISTLQEETSGASLAIGSIDGIDEAYVGQTIEATINMLNLAAEDYKGTVRMDIYRAGESTRLARINVSAEIVGKSQATLHFSMIAINTEGEYELQFNNNDGSIGDRIPITVRPALDYEYGQGDMRLAAISDTWFDVDAEVKGNLTFSNVGSNALTFIPLIKFYDEEMNEVASRSVEAITVPSKEKLTATLNLGKLELAPGKYRMAIISESFGNISPLVPVQFYRAGETDEVAYKILSDKEHSARIVAPVNGVYVDEVTIPAVVEEKYDVVEIDGGAMAFADKMTSVVIPSSVNKIPSGAFFASGIGTLRIESETPPTLGDKAFSRTGYTTTILSVPAGSAPAYKAAEGWDVFHIPCWTFENKENISVTLPETQPLYVAGDEAAVIRLGADANGYAVIVVGDETTVIDLSPAAELTLPVLGTKDGVCTFVTEYSGLSTILAAAMNADVYTIQGILVKRNANVADIETLPAGLYVIGNIKYLKR